MPLQLKVVIVKPGLWGLGKQELRNAGREAIEYAGLYWHEHYKAFHFQKFAYAKYGYQRRTAKYERSKQKLHPEAEGRPNVFTGESERSAMASNKVRATAKSWESFHADVIINAPTLNYTQRHAEIIATTAGEDAQLSNQFARRFTDNFLAVAASHQTTLPLTQLTAG